MSDLSRLLGDVYGSGGAAPDSDEETSDEETAAEPAQATTLSGALPEWADESILDEAFANWVPGPPSEAPEVERGMLADLAADPPTVETPPPVEARPATLAEALAEQDFIFPQTEEEPAAVPALATPRWQRGDDDLLPVRGRGRRRR